MRNEVAAAQARRDYLLSNIAEVEGPLETPCWEWQRHRHQQGYGLIDHRGIVYKAHRLSWVLHCGNIPEGLNVLHRCDNCPCLNPDHLWLGTQQENVIDMYMKGRRRDCRGELQGQSNLSDADAANIKGLFLLPIPYYGFHTEVANRYNVGPHVIWGIASGKSYAHVQPSSNPVMPPIRGLLPIQRRQGL